VPGIEARPAGYVTGMRSRLSGASAALLVAVGLAGCAPVHDDEVRDVATRFYAAHADDDGTSACAELAPRTRSELEQSAGKPCPEAVLAEDVPQVGAPEDVRVFGTQAEVTWDGETTFLARFQGGWKVMAAACTARPDQPYDCSISGG
jgi:hypothetical protein